MANNNNSISSILKQMMTMYNNIVEMFTKYKQIISSNKETVTISVKDENNIETQLEVPTIGYLRNKISALENTVKALTDTSSSNVNLRLPSGEFKQLIDPKIKKDPDRIVDLQPPTTFFTRTNNIQADFLNPLLYVGFDVSSNVGIDSNQAYVKKMILNIDSSDKLSLFNSILKNKNDIEYQDIVVFLTKNNINFSLFEQTIDFPKKVVQYSGTFSVIGITTNSSTGNKVYQLNKITYSNNLDVVVDGLSLAVGDVLLRGKYTRYEIVSVDTSKRTVELKLVSGTEVIPIGLDVLTIESDVFSRKLIQINVGYNEYLVVFVRSIDSHFDVVSSKWSKGTAFYTNDLGISTPKGTISLSDYYNQEVVDYGKILQGLAKENIISASAGVLPSAPTLTNTNFQVVQINKHIFSGTDSQTLESLGAEKIRLQDKLSKIDASILTVTATNTTTNLEQLKTQRSTVSQQLATVVSNIKSISSNGGISTSQTPKYRIRGFWPIPQTSDGSNIVQFIVSYRYLQLDGNSNPTDTIPFTDNDNQKTNANYSNWIEYQTSSRQKIYSVEKGVYVWNTEDVSNPDIVNINQLDIPINNGEKVEIRIKSVSEAGWPINPLVSDWSTSVIVDFPKDLNTESTINTVLNDIGLEENRAIVQQELAAKNIDAHVQSTKIIDNKIITHTADEILVDKTTTGTPVTIADKLNQIQSDITKINSQVSTDPGKLSVKIVDDNNNIVAINNGDTINIYAGSYSDLISQLPESSRKGAIIRKTYRLVLENSGSAPLELGTKLPGSSDDDLPGLTNQLFNGISYIDPEYYYGQLYDSVPLMYTDVSGSLINNEWPKLTTTQHQSSQLLSQFLYSRHNSVGLTRPVYADAPTGVPRWYGASSPKPGKSLFVWNGQYSNLNVPMGNGTLSEFCIHTDHPYLSSGLEIGDLQIPNFSVVFRRFGGGLSLVDGSTDIPLIQLTSAFRHSYYFNFDKSHQYGHLQLEYKKPNAIQIGSSSDTSVYEQFPDMMSRYPDKIGFLDEDRYLIGKNTCGSYLYLAPQNTSSLVVDGQDFKAKKLLYPGSSNAIVVPIVFEFRMSDYYGNGPDTGIIGGWSSNGPNDTQGNIVYSKTLGLDIYQKNDTRFSFDITISSDNKTGILIYPSYPTI